MSDEQQKELVAVRIRSSINISQELKDTLQKLRLSKPQSCVILPQTPVFTGMLKKVQHLVTWGELDQPTKQALEKRKVQKETKIPMFALHPPRRGYGRKGVKLPFSKGGAAGNRGKEISKLLERMV